MTEKHQSNSTEKAITDKDGHFRRADSKFRNFISPDPNALFPAEKDRYVLYVNYGCPWAHRTLIVRALKGLEEIIPIIESPGMEEGKGWYFDEGSDRFNGIRYLSELYHRSDPEFNGRFTVPVLWDLKKGTIVNNESSEVIRILYSAFDQFLPPEQREETKGKAGLFPEYLRPQIEEMNEWVYNTVNNGVYKTGFSTTQEAYDSNVKPLFESLDRLEKHLDDPGHQPYLFGEHITEADIRLYTTMARFDVAYFTIFKCNLKMVRYEYPNLHRWLRTLYWDESKMTNGGAFKKTTRFELYKEGYAKASHMATKAPVIIPIGPVPDIMRLD